MWGDLWGTMVWGSPAAVPLLGPWGVAALVVSFLGGGYLLQSRRRTRWMSAVAMCALLSAPLTAISAVALPYVFVNGTVADADEVNANFNTITQEFSNYHVELDVASEGVSVQIPDPILFQLCADDDGCTLRIISLDRAGAGTSFPFVSDPVFLYFDSGNRTWDSTDTTGPGLGTDGDNNPAFLARVDNDCYFHDGEFTGFSSGSDNVAGINVLLWTGTGNPDRRCLFTIVD